jgi:hypothetical protein
MRSNQNTDRWNFPENTQFFPKKNDLRLNLQTKVFIPKQKKFEEIKEINSPESIRTFDPHYLHNNQFNDYKSNCSLLLSDRKDLEDDEKLNTSLISVHSTGAASRKSTDVSFKAKFKTEKCKYWDLNKNCKYGDNCAFAHGSNEIRQKYIPSTNYKTKKCKQFFENGFCPYGSRCQFLHKDEDITPFSYKNLLKAIEEKGESKIDTSKRLKIFEKITQEKKPKRKNIEVSIYDEKSIYQHNL